MGGIASIPGIQSTLTFGTQGVVTPQQEAANRATITGLYQELLGRAPDDNAMQTTLAVMNSGAETPEGLRTNIMKSPEYQQRQAAGSAIAA